MKKILIIISALLSVTLPLAAADLDPLHPAHRYFEIGFDVQAMGTNNYFNAKSLFVKDLVIDLNKIATEMPSNGLLMNALVRGPESYWNLNLKNGFHLGMAYGIEGNITGNIGKNLFELIGYGNVDNTTINVDGYANADLFAYYTVSGGFKLGTMRITVKPSVFAPMIHAQTDSLNATVSNPSDGSVRVTANAVGTVYSATDLSSYENGFSQAAQDEITRNMFSGAGFDLAGAVEMPVLSFLQVGAYARIPIVPGSLKYSASGTATMTYSAASLSDIVNGAGESSTSLSDIQYNTANYYISRPLRLGGESAFRPFGNWFTVSTLLGIGVRYPYTADYKMYPEYSLGASVDLFKIIGVSLSTSYLSEIFIHKVNVMLNCRVLELNVAALLAGSGGATTAKDFGTELSNSFKGTGAGAEISISIGF